MSNESKRGRLEVLEARDRLNTAADEALELALRDRLSLAPTLRSLLPLLASHANADFVWVRTFDENLELRDFSYGGTLPFEPDDIQEGTDRGDRLQRRVGDQTLLAQPLDVAGETFGSAAIVLRGVADPEKLSIAASLLDVWCEELDNYLASIAHARQKERIGRALGEALEEPVLEVGVNRALEVLSQEVSFDDLFLVFRHQDDLRGATLHYRVMNEGKLLHESRSPDMEIDEFVRLHGPSLIAGDSRALLERFGIAGGREEVLLAGVRDQRQLGRLVVTSKHEDFNTFDRDLLQRFASMLRRRVVDFNRQWKRLTQFFAPSVARRLLQHEDHVERFLAPRLEDVAILFCDISGFTRISEQVMSEPHRIGALVDEWSRQAVDVLWETGGVFDKMVGDCIIGLWGPPFFEGEAAMRCQQAAVAAHRIRALTRAMKDHPDFPELKDLDPPITVSTGLGFAPLFVGLFGPNEDYTGFSSGMNNTARLQGVAPGDEILCSAEFCETLGRPELFGDPGEAKVKNVADPLRFRPLITDPG